MAPIGRVRSTSVPSYRHCADLVIPLRYPFHLGGRKIAAAEIVPPTLAELEWLAAGAGRPVDILAVATTLDAAAIAALRWPDAEAILVAARAVLPPDLVRRLDGGADEPAPMDGERAQPEESTLPEWLPAEGREGDVAEDLGMVPGPADFAVRV